jgi:hypothetical protein
MSGSASADIFVITSASADFFQRMSASGTYQVSAGADALAKIAALVNPDYGIIKSLVLLVR